METPPPAETPGQKARALLKILQESYPAFRDFQPLAIGIDKEVLARQPGIERKTLRLALGMHTNSLRYLKVLEKATHRVDLDGKPGDKISEEHRTHAAEVLRERFRKDAERRKAEREAAEREKQRAAKLTQLVEKFGKNR